MSRSGSVIARRVLAFVVYLAASCKGPNPLYERRETQETTDGASGADSPGEPADNRRVDQPPDASDDACTKGPCASLSVGLVGHWSLDEGQGLVAADSSGFDNPAVLKNGPTWTTNTFVGATFPNPHALAFDGVNDYLEVADPPSGVLDFGTGSFTCSLWVNVDRNTTLYDTAMVKGGWTASVAGYDMELGAQGWYFNVADGARIAQARFATDGPLGQWVHLVGVRDAASEYLRTYTNGTLVDTQPHPSGSVSNALPLWLGDGNGSYPFSGVMDDVRIYNRALSAEEIAALHAGQ